MDQKRQILIILDENGKVIYHSDAAEISDFDKKKFSDLVLGAKILSMIFAMFFVILSIASLIVILAGFITGISSANLRILISPVPVSVASFILVSFVLSVYSFSRIAALRRRLLEGYLFTAYIEDSTFLNIIAIVFNGILPGLFLILAKRMIGHAIIWQ
ncbi:hypothetical protein [Thermoplasma sp.]|uniref:hypothetical protein n=1 Tax=Thermoplasma sp. TaxID=1973142 RepID=UPI00128417EE|nr:hypothetical protein [Thermoplasma sp.]KAA8922585.1 MAG: hypothetical protein F6Q11_03810 [Thermoplasma sp.]